MVDEEMSIETDTPGTPVAPPVESIESDEELGVDEETNEANTGGVGDGGEAAEESDNDAPGDVEDETIDTTDVTDGKVSNDLYKAFKAITEVLLNFKIKNKTSEEHFPAGLFKRLPNKRLLPDYYEVIQEPSAISTLRGKIQRKQYSGVPEFVRDFALVVYNAQVYNRPNSQPVRDVLKLDELFKAELQKLVEAGYATEEDIAYPDLGEIPYASPEPDPVSEDDEGEDEGEDDDDDDEADESDDDKRKRKGRRGTKSGPAGKKGEEDEEEDKGGDAEQKRRGRPPKVATPMEHRIDKILKSLKKPKASNGAAMIGPFERLPDKAELPDYYQVITNPIAYDILKKKAKRKKYSSIDDFMKDVELMFNNATTFNEDGSDIHKWAQELLEEAKRVEAEERAKPDSEYLQAAEGRIPLPHIVHKGDMWKVGDWIHIQNPNDITKPIVAQIYRTWKTVNDEEWINACWYYRPEQTVHQHEKHFYPNEVVKTGQYRDHKIEEVLNKCFVMFYTRYSRGRPRNLPAEAEVYVCEARYNEDKFKFNKIKTWASCLPDEVRDKDYEMDLFDAPRKIKKVASPLLSRLKEDAKETDEPPQPEWKHANAPPLVGGIHKRPRDENQSPPPEPTPPPQPTPVPVVRTPSISQNDNMKVPVYSQTTPAAYAQSQAQSVRPTPSMTPQTSFGSSNVNQYSRQQSYTGPTHPYPSQTPGAQTQPAQQYQFTQQQQPPPLVAAHPGSYTQTTAALNYNRAGPNLAQSIPYNAQPVSLNNQQRTAEAYVLSDAANASIPKDIRDQFPQDGQGRLLFFTTPPLSTQHLVSGSSEVEQSRPLQHTERYVESLTIRKRKLQIQRKSESEDVEFINGNDEDSRKQAKTGGSQARDAHSGRQAEQAEAVTEDPMLKFTNQMKQATYNEYKSRYGEEWRQTLLADLAWGEGRRAKEIKEDSLNKERRKLFSSSHLQSPNGQFALNRQGYVAGWQKNFFTGTYLDDFDTRLP